MKITDEVLKRLEELQREVRNYQGGLINEDELLNKVAHGVAGIADCLYLTAIEKV